MTQKELSSLIFTVVLFEKENIRNRAEFKETTFKSDLLTMDR